VLVDDANDELDVEERQLEQLQRDIQLHWQTDLRCIIRTKVRYLENLTNLGGGNLASEQIKESIECLTNFLEIVEDNRASKGGSETWHFRLNLWHDRFDRVANIYRFATEGDLRKSPRDLTAIQTDYWLELIRSRAAQQYHRITTNPLMDEDWLKVATRQINIDPKLQQDLVAQFKLGRVWILLDAVDEMGIDASIALVNLARQLRGWVGGVHIILTCRSNVWDSGKNALENFTTYHNLSLSNGYNPWHSLSDGESSIK